MRVIDKSHRNTRYVVGMGMMKVDSYGNMYRNSKTKEAVNRAFGKGIMGGIPVISNVEAKIESEISKGVSDVKPLKDNVVQAVKQGGLRELVRKGKEIPNVEAVVAQVAPLVPLSETANKAVKSVKTKSLSDVLSKKGPKKGQGIYLHGSQKANGMYLHGSGFQLA